MSGPIDRINSSRIILLIDWSSTISTVGTGYLQALYTGPQAAHFGIRVSGWANAGDEDESPTDRKVGKQSAGSQTCTASVPAAWGGVESLAGVHGASGSVHLTTSGVSPPFCPVV